MYEIAHFFVRSVGSVLVDDEITAPHLVRISPASYSTMRLIHLV